MEKSLLLRTIFHRLYQNIIQYTTIPLGKPELRKSAIIFSPHPDDETLGCGGTIILKKKLGAEIKIVFLTDGTASHKHLASREQLKETRIQEALSAGQELGIEKSGVIFLAFEDGKIHENQEAVLAQVEDILSKYQPEEIFIPYFWEPLPDHAATNRIVRLASQNISATPVVNEYLIWFWRHWPWISQVEDQQSILTYIRKSLKTDLGKIVRDFRYSVSIADVMKTKRAALEMHRSQMTRLIPDQHWETLADLSGGEFLACFFQEKELFRRYQL